MYVIYTCMSYYTKIYIKSCILVFTFNYIFLQEIQKIYLSNLKEKR